MGILENARTRFIRNCWARDVDPSARIAVRPLSSDEAIGPKAGTEFVIKKGKERVIEATFSGARGQAFTDQPTSWSGRLEDLFALDLSQVPLRAVFVAGMNAVLRALDEAKGTAHCADEDPMRCGPEVARTLGERFGAVRVGLIGLQPAILAALADRFGPASVRVLDLDPNSIGTTKSGVPIWDGHTDLARLVDWCGVGLATGSSLINGTIDDIYDRFGGAGKPLVFFGNTISGAAALLGLDRLCPFGR
jgi:hypothetical protein